MWPSESDNKKSEVGVFFNDYYIQYFVIIYFCNNVTKQREPTTTKQ